MNVNTTEERDVIAALRQTGRYASTSGRGRSWWPALTFYRRVFMAVCRSNGGFRNVQGLEPLLNASLDVLEAVEAAGGRVEIDGVEHLNGLEEPVVLVGNHVSSLETFVLPGIILPFTDTTFVLKRSLLAYPVLGGTLRRLRAIAVDRKDARADLMTVLTDGAEKLSSGRSVVVFPQSTRTTTFDPAAFNSLGVKLAKKGGVRVLPFAVDTRFWGSGRWIKDIGPIDPEITVRISFGAPLAVVGNGKSAQAEVVAFVQNRLEEWR